MSRHLLLFASLLLVSVPLFGHCDTMEGPVRVLLAVSEGVSPDSCAPEWDFSLDPTPIAFPVVDNEGWDGDEAGSSSLVSDPKEADELRAWWLAELETPTSCDRLDDHGYGFKDPPRNRSYALWMRDAVPFEDEHGLIPIPFP